MARKLEASYLVGISAIKNLQSHYINMSHEFSTMLGWNKAQDSIGKTDYQIPSNVSEFAEEFRRNDHEVITSHEKIITLDFQNYRTGWKLIILEKHPIKDHQDNIIGVYLNGIDLSKTNLYRGYLTLHELCKTLTGKKPKAVSYILDQSQPFDLTQKQEICLFFLVRGKTIKEIAKILKISPRTVESHIDSIKNKLKCECKSQLIEKVIEGGFFYHIPKKLLEISL